jgi:hypothetical protein
MKRNIAQHFVAVISARCKECRNTFLSAVL